jgi:hypothetical protein
MRLPQPAGLKGYRLMTELQHASPAFWGPVAMVAGFATAVQAIPVS